MKKQTFPLLAVLTAALTGMGCDSNYSTAITYGVRVDPLVTDKNLGDERVEPDRPGMFPLLFAKDVNEPFNPLFPYRNDLFTQKKLRDPTLIQPEVRQDLERVLVMLFGSPSSPHILVDTDVKEALKLQDENIERGTSLYRVHCLHCHGVTGDGRGPTARWVNPHPRDYRQGLFKFMSVDQTGGPRPPRREDLFRVIHHGIESTAMPSFGLLRNDELEDMVSYVIHLSIRGNVEFDTIKYVFSYDPEKNTLTPDLESGETLEDRMRSSLNRIAGDWVDSQKKEREIAVAPYPYDDRDRKVLKESIQRGYQFFRGEPEDKPGWPAVSKEDAKKFNCVSCHKDFGRQALYKFDEWGTLVKPRDLTQGIYRGGRRPVDLYYRVHSGIQPSGMTSFGKDLAKTEYLWDLVNFVKTLPYPAMRKSMGIVID